MVEPTSSVLPCGLHTSLTLRRSSSTKTLPPPTTSLSRPPGRSSECNSRPAVDVLIALTSFVVLQNQGDQATQSATGSPAPTPE